MKIIKPQQITNKKFSVMIPTLERRKHFFDRVLESLTKSFEKLSKEEQELVEVVYLIDKGEKSIGNKRNELIQRASGDYVAFVDDDDLVSENYFQFILNAIKYNTDVIGVWGIIDFDNEKPSNFYLSLDYKTWFDVQDPSHTDRRIYYRNPNHLNPVKRMYALRTQFPPISDGEDRVYSHNLMPLLKTEVKVTEPIYFYKCRLKKEC